MIAKEWRDARWKFALGAVFIVALAVLAVGPYEWASGGTFRAPVMVPEGLPLPDGFPRELSPAESAVYSLEEAFARICGFVLIPLAVLLGVALVAGETESNAVIFLLSRPIGRNRLLALKYGVAAAALLVVAVLGGIGIVGSAAARGYPVGQISAFGVALSAALLWLGSLFVLSTALLMSVVFRNVLYSLAATAVALYATFIGPNLLSAFLSVPVPQPSGPPEWTFGWLEWLNPYGYWGGELLYLGEGLAGVNFLVYSVLAAAPLLVALWVFRRKSY